MTPRTHIQLMTMMTIPGAMLSLGTGGGAFVPGGQYHISPGLPKTPFFSKKLKKNLKERQDYKKYIVINIAY